jgi:hypothetical protein
MDRMDDRSLPTPPIANDPIAMEALRVWVRADAGQQLVLNPIWDEPEAWGLLLADIARHAARAYSRVDLSEEEALNRILALFQVEMGHPTDIPQRLS